MMLPQIQGRLERYLSELPSNIEVDNIETNNFTMQNRFVSGRYEYIYGYNNLNYDFYNFFPEEGIYLHLVADYFPEKRKAEVGTIALRKKNVISALAIQVNESSLGILTVAKPETLEGASDFLNRVLDKYDFNSFYEEFERRRKYEIEQI